MTQREILKIQGLTTRYETFGGKRVINAVNNVSFTLNHKDTLAVIGESGCGKSTLGLSIVGVLPEAARITAGEVLFEGKDILKMKPDELSKIRGRKISMILQDPMTSLNPVYTIGNQIGETLRFHLNLRGKKLVEQIKRLILDVKIPKPERRIKQYPHEFSGGMMQRIVGAIAISCEPSLLICDEPTTNLDVTIQLQYLELLKDIQSRTGVTLMFITHDLGIVAEMCRRVLVMYAGKIVERASVMEVFDHPQHPYTKALLEAAFGLTDLRKKSPVYGEPPNLSRLPSGCSFHPRCRLAEKICRESEPPEISLNEETAVKCWRYAA